MKAESNLIKTESNLMNTENRMIVLNELSYFYHTFTLCFNLQINTGERVAILGPSGAGKSTLLGLIAGLVSSDSGSLWLNGEDHTLTSPAKRPVSMLFQDHNLFSHLTVEQNIGLGLDPGLKLNQRQQQQRTDISQRVGLQELVHRLPAELSGGQRQRVALARCLVRQQPILLLDEPFSALDPALRYDMLDLLNQAGDERNLTLLMVSHNLEDAARIAPRTLVIVDGKIYYDGTTQELLNGKAEAASILGVLAHQ